MKKKKDYSKPQLNVIGTIEEITQGEAKDIGTQDAMQGSGPVYP